MQDAVTLTPPRKPVRCLERMQAVVQLRENSGVLSDEPQIGHERVLHRRTIDLLERQVGAAHRDDARDRIAARVDVPHDLDLARWDVPTAVPAQDRAITEIEDVGVATRGEKRQLGYGISVGGGVARSRTASRR